MFDFSKHNFVPQETSSRCAVCGRPFEEHGFSPPSALDGAVCPTEAATRADVDRGAEDALL